MGDNTKCPQCGSTSIKVYRDGMKLYGRRVRAVCRECGNAYFVGGGWEITEEKIMVDEAEMPIEQVNAELKAAGIEIPDCAGKLIKMAADAYAARDAAQAACVEMTTLLGRCRSDIFQTARANQANINGIELNCPDDPPCESRIGTHFVSQAGVDESLRLVREIEIFLSPGTPGRAIMAKLARLWRQTMIARKRASGMAGGSPRPCCRELAKELLWLIAGEAKGQESGASDDGQD